MGNSKSDQDSDLPSDKDDLPINTNLLQRYIDILSTKCTGQRRRSLTHEATAIWDMLNTKERAIVSDALAAEDSGLDEFHFIDSDGEEDCLLLNLDNDSLASN